MRSMALIIEVPAGNIGEGHNDQHAAFDRAFSLEVRAMFVDVRPRK
jgi:hypothetical protein